MHQLLDDLARERGGKEPDWTPYHYEHTDNPKGIILIGAVTPLFKSGPRKGKPNWKAMDDSTRQTMFIPCAEWEAYKVRWERETGKCEACLGVGEKLVFASSNGERRYKPCPKCHGTGKSSTTGA